MEQISLTDEQTNKIATLAALFFSPKEIAIMLGVSVNDFVTACHSEDNQCYNAFYSGRLQSEVNLRNSILKLANSGSSPAQTMAMDLLNKSKIKLRDK